MLDTITISLYIIFNPWRGYSLKISRIALSLICLFAILIIVGPACAVENSRVNLDLVDGINNIGNGVYIISPSSIVFTTNFEDELYVAQRVSMIIAERPDLEYVSLTPHASGYGQTVGYIAIFRPKHVGNYTCLS